MQMKLIYKYMQTVSHENRFILDRLMHIFWVLAMLVLIQFHLLHISRFSYVSQPTDLLTTLQIKCMSDQIISSMEHTMHNHSYALTTGGLNHSSLDETRAELMYLKENLAEERYTLFDLEFDTMSSLVDLEKQRFKFEIEEKCPLS